jgi:phosphosulfolactate synthase (CoM biosynthesis protein A)
LNEHPTLPKPCLTDAAGIERLMFEAADPPVFTWYLKHYGPAVNLFVDHSQIVQLEAARRGWWATHDLWGRMGGYGSGGD